MRMSEYFAIQTISLVVSICGKLFLIPFLFFLLSYRNIFNITTCTSHLQLLTHFCSCRSHHEKIVIVDNEICFIGGLDLCFGRFDTSEHNVADYPPLIWPGKDYYNPRYFPH